MIVGFVGTPGSGKSYDAVRKIIDNLRLGRIVYTNIDGFDDPQCLEAIKSICGFDDYTLAHQLHYLSKSDAVQVWKIAKNGSLIVLDEVHKLFSNRDWNSDKNKDFAEWASTHRHYGYDVVLLTQDIEKVDKHVRSMLEWCYYYRKVNYFGSFIKNKYTRYSYVGDDHNGKPLANKTFSYDPTIFHCYKSYAWKDAKEVGFMQHVNILKHPLFYSIPVLIGVFIYFFSRSSFATGDVLGSKKMIHKQVKPPSPVASASGSAPSLPVQGRISTAKVTLPPAAPSIPLPVSSPYPTVASYQPLGAVNKSPENSFVIGRGGYIWTDKKGITHITNDKTLIPPGAKFDER